MAGGSPGPWRSQRRDWLRCSWFKGSGHSLSTQWTLQLGTNAQTRKGSEQGHPQTHHWTCPTQLQFQHHNSPQLVHPQGCHLQLC